MCAMVRWFVREVVTKTQTTATSVAVLRDLEVTTAKRVVTKVMVRALTLTLTLVMYLEHHFREGDFLFS